MYDWYNVTQEDVYKHGGRGILTNYCNSNEGFSTTQMAALEVCKQKVKNYREYFGWLGVNLGHKSMEDWYTVTMEDIWKHGGKDSNGMCYASTFQSHGKCVSKPQVVQE